MLTHKLLHHSFVVLLASLAMAFTACVKDGEQVEDEVGAEDDLAEEGDAPAAADAQAQAQAEPAAAGEEATASQELSDAETEEVGDDELAETAGEGEASSEAPAAAAEEEVVEEVVTQTPNQESATAAAEAALAAPPVSDTEGEAKAEAPMEVPPPEEAAAAPLPLTSDTAAPVTSEPTIASGSVQYVKNDGVKIYSQPQGNVVRNADKGDHFVVVDVKDGWAQLSSDHYIASRSLSAKAVGRSRGKLPWQSKSK